jgi:hypothetical protein
MATPEQARQSGLRFLSFNMETTVGTAKSPAESPSKWLTIPMINVSLADSRGTQRVTNSGIGDGRPGNSGSQRGSFGSVISATAFFNDVTNYIPPIVKLLTVCGYEVNATARVNGPPVVPAKYVITPSTKPLTDYPSSETAFSTDLIPATCTVAHVQVDGGTGDSLERRAGCTGGVVFTANAGDALQANFSLVGFIPDGDDMREFSGPYSDLCAFGANEKGPRAMWRDVSVQTLVRTGEAEDYFPVNFSTFTLTPEHTTPDVVDPTTEYGFSYSPVVIGNATLSFSIASTRANEQKFLNDFRDGKVCDVKIVFDMPTCTIEFRAPKVIQNSLPVEADAGGLRQLTFTGDCTRPLDSDDATHTITITEKP